MTNEELPTLLAVDPTRFPAASAASAYFLGLGAIGVLKLTVGIAVAASAIVFRKYVAAVAIKATKHVLQEGSPEQQKALQVLPTPLSFLTVFIGVFFAVNIIDLPTGLDTIAAHVGQTFLNITIFWVAFQAVEPVSQLWVKTGASSHSFGEEIREMTVKVLQTAISICGALAILEVWGVNVSAFLAGLGLVGMAAALAAQDTIKNLFGSVVILSDKLFHKGDWIKTPDAEGIVEHFGLRTTQIRKFDTSLLTLPNATIANSTIINFNRGTRREVSWTIKISGSASSDQLVQIVNEFREFLKTEASVEHEAQVPLVNVAGFGEGCYEIFVYFHIKTPDWVPFLENRQKIVLELSRIVAKAGASFALPVRVLHQKQ